MSEEIERVEFSILKSGLKGVAIGSEHLFLAVEYDKKKWKFRLVDLHGGFTWITAWITVYNIEDLRIARSAKALRDQVKKEYGDAHTGIFERMIGTVQDNKSEWEQTESEESGQPSDHEQQLEEEAQKEAEEILSSPDVPSALLPHLDNVAVGEKENKQLGFILFLGKRKIPMIIIIRGDPGAGKTQLAKLSRAFKTKEVARFSAHALDYINLEEYDILWLKELGSMDQEFQGVSTVKFLSADDQGYTVEVTVKDEDGRFTTAEYKIPPMTVLTTTTRIEVEPQFERRAWSLNPDESKQQTERVRLWKANLEREKAEVALGLRRETSYDHSLRVLKAVAEGIKPCNVIIPFPESLTEILGIEKLRLRGDYDKFYGLVKLYGCLHRRTLPLIKGVNGHEAVLVLPEHAFKALKIAEKPYATMTSDLEERSRNLIAKMEELNITTAGDSIDLDLRAKIAVTLGKSETTVKRYFDDWERAGYVSSTEGKGRGRPRIFHLLYDLDVIEKKASVSFDIDKLYAEMGSKFAKETESFLNRLSTKVSWGNGYTFQKILEEIYIGIPPSPVVDKQTKDKETLITEKEQISSYNSQMSEDMVLSKEKLDYLRRNFHRGTQQAFQKVAEEIGISKEDSEDLFQRLVDEGQIAMDPEGLWQWV